MVGASQRANGLSNTWRIGCSCLGADVGCWPVLLAAPTGAGATRAAGQLRRLVPPCQKLTLSAASFAALLRRWYSGVS